MTFAQYNAQFDDDFATSYEPAIFHDSRGQDDNSLMSDSLDNYSLNMMSIDDL